MASVIKVDTIQPRTGSVISVPSGYTFSAPNTAAQTIVNRYTSAITTTSGTAQAFFSTSITTKTASPIIMVYFYCKQRCDISGWCLGHFYINETVTGTNVMTSGYNGTNSSGWIHDYNAEKPFYAPGAAGTTYTFQVYVYSYSTVTNYFNNPGQSSDDGYAIMKLTEIAR